MIKDHPKFADPNNARWRSSVPPNLESISIGEGIVGLDLVTLLILRDLLVGKPKRPSERTKPLEKM